jgi:DNA-binding winged helix-turn-helix (wHTH) protein
LVHAQPEGSVPATPSIHAFGSFRLDPAERLLLRNDQPVSLTPKAFDLLTYLVDRRGRLVTKQELLTAIWPDTFVEE